MGSDIEDKEGHGGRFHRLGQHRLPLGAIRQSRRCGSDHVPPRRLL